MGEIERRYSDGDIIFHEGQRSRDAYIVVTGQVELLKSRPGGRVRLALLNPGEIFGEMGVVNRSVRSATARAVGPVVLEVIEREGFLETLREKPEMAMRMIGTLSQRLRAADEMITPPNTRPRSRTVWDVLDTFLRQRRETKRVLEVRIAPIAGETQGAMTARLVAGFAHNKLVRAKPVAAPLWAAVKTPSDVAAAGAAGRQILARDNADIVVWGAFDESAGTLTLRFVPRTPDADHPGAFLMTDRLVLPAVFGAGFARLLIAVVVAASSARGEVHRRWLEQLLTKALEDVHDSGQQPPLDMTLADRATIQACYAHVAATLGYHTGESSWYRQAADAYAEAEGNMRGDAAALDAASVRYHLARVRLHLGERARDPAALDAGIAGLREAMESFTQEAFPWEWANAQAALGAALYRLDSLRSDTETLKASIAAYQSALLVFTRADAPMKWADAKNGLGQALQMWGDMARNAELLQRAVQCCLEALQVRTRTETPLLWAASQNNLGSALYLLGRLTEDSEYLEGSAEAFGKALEVYLAYRLVRLSKITERNLAKAEDLLRARLARKVARVYWEDEGDQARAERLERQRMRTRAAE
jgi:CRP-like cAMP-binding protein/tetratricopeptide (TPR) repeat protein